MNIQAEGCARTKREGTGERYREMLRGLEREASRASLTAGVVALFAFSLLPLAAAFALPGKNTQGGLAVFVIALVCGGLGLFGSLLWYVLKAREHMRAGSVELDFTHPGFFEYYQRWQAKLDEITSRYEP